MATINFNTNTSVNTNEVKAGVNLTTTKKKNVVDVIRKHEANFLAINGTPVGLIGGNKKELDANVKCIQYVLDNLCPDPENLREVMRRFTTLTTIMAKLEGVDLSHIVKACGDEFILDLEHCVVLNCMGDEWYRLLDHYKEINPENLTESDKINLLKAVLPRDDEEELEEEENPNVINIHTPDIPTYLEAIVELRKMGLRAKYVYIDEVKTTTPVCYTSEADINSFESAVKDCVEVEVDYVTALRTKAQLNELEADTKATEMVEIEGKECLYQPDINKIVTIGGHVVADLSDIEGELTPEVAKAVLIERAREELYGLNLDGFFEG